MHATTHCRAPTVPLAIMLLAALPTFAHANIAGTTPAAKTAQYVYYAAGLKFTTSQYINGSQRGLVGNGVTDNTNAFRTLLGKGDRTIHISAGTYVTGPIDIPRDTVLLLDPGVIIKDSGKLGAHDKLINISQNNIYIRAMGATVLSDRGFYHGGEYRHGVFITGATDVVIDGLQSNGNSGDGFYIGSAGTTPDRNVTLENCSASHNRRDGLSITSGVNISVVHCAFSDNRGTAPQYGIDIEPNVSEDPLANIKINDVRTMGNGNGGISIYLGPKYRPQRPISIDIVNHQSSNEYRRFHSHGINQVPGTVIYNGKRIVTP